MPKKSSSQPSSSTHSSASAGIEETVAGWYRSYFNRLLAYGLLIHPERAQVEDAIQELFIWLFRHPEQVAKIDRVEVYLFQALKRNLWKKLGRKQQARQSLQRFLHSTQPNETTLSVEADWIQDEEAAEQVDLLRAKLAELPPYLREVLYLHYYQGLSYQEISQVLQVSPQVARNYASRALKRLRHFMRDQAQLVLALAALFQILQR